MAPGSRWVYRETATDGALQTCGGQGHRQNPTDRERRYRPGGARHGDREGPARRGHVRLVRAGPARQRLVPGRGHQGLRERQGRVDQGLLGSRRERRRAGSSCPHIRARGCSTARSTCRARPRTRRGCSASTTRPRSRRGISGGSVMTKDWNPLDPKVLEYKLYARGSRAGAGAHGLRRRRPRGAVELQHGVGCAVHALLGRPAGADLAPPGAVRDVAVQRRPRRRLRQLDRAAARLLRTALDDARLRGHVVGGHERGNGFEWFIVGFAFVVDVGSYAGGRSSSAKRD